MDIVKKVFRSFVTADASKDMKFPADVKFTTDCSTCDDNCSIHNQIPEYLAKKIDMNDPLVGTMKPYRQHVLVRLGSGKTWSEKLEETQSSFIASLKKSIDESQKDKQFRTVLSAFEDVSASQEGVSEITQSAQVVLFPQQTSFNVALDGIGAFVDEHLAKPGLAGGSNATAWPYRITVFVCTHKKRDKRCGVAGPLILDEFIKVRKELQIEKHLGIFGISHIGGHKYAGNIILYRKDAEGRIHGDWFGRVKPCNVKHILENALKGEIVQDLWRGRMDMDW